jgi:VanZ family protein
VISQEQPTSGSSLSLKLLGLLGLAITIAVVYFYLNPNYPLKQSVTNTFLGDKVIHLFSFGLLMYSFSLFVKQNRIRIVLGICLVLLGVGLEMLQAPMGGGQFEFADIIANTLGVVIGYLATKFHAV